MNTFAWITLGTTIGVASPIVLNRLRARRLARSGSAQSPNRTMADLTSRHSIVRPTPNKYAGVEISVPMNGCAAAEAQKGRRYLQSEAPMLPLAGCNREHCRCKFVKYSDRRDGEDRRADLGEFATIHDSANSNRRRGPGRRDSD